MRPGPGPMAPSGMTGAPSHWPRLWMPVRKLPSQTQARRSRIGGGRRRSSWQFQSRSNLKLSGRVKNYGPNLHWQQLQQLAATKATRTRRGVRGRGPGPG